MDELKACNTLNFKDCLKYDFSNNLINLNFSDEISHKLQLDFNYWLQISLDEFQVLDNFDFTKLFSTFSTWVFCFSILLFLYAHRVVRSTAIFYSGGACLGIFSSLIIIALVLQKLLPRRALAFPLYLGGWPISLYIYYKAWQNFGLILRNYFPYFILYITIMILVSFAVCYRFGPPSNLRTLNLIKWSLQILACIGIYFSCTIRLLSIITILSLLTWPFWFKLASYISTFTCNLFQLLRTKIFGPNPRRLLTQAEYEAESNAYTQMQIKQLKMFCRNSPSTKNWKMISRLSDPKKMASFINGDSDHVTGEEYSMHASILWPDEDDDIDVDDDSCNYITKPLMSNNWSYTKPKSTNNDSYSDFVTDDDDDQ